MSERSRIRAARHAAEKKGVSSAIQRTTRQSPYKMRLVIDQIRGKDVNEALGLLKFSKKHAAKQIAKVLNSRSRECGIQVERRRTSRSTWTRSTSSTRS